MQPGHSGLPKKLIYLILDLMLVLASYDCDWSWNLTDFIALAACGGDVRAYDGCGGFLLHANTQATFYAWQVGACLMIVIIAIMYLASIFPFLAVVMAVLFWKVCLLLLYILAHKVGLHILVLACNL